MEYERLTDRIARDGELQAEKILEEAEQEAARIVEQKKEEAKRKAWEDRGDAVQAAEAEAKRIIESSTVGARPKARLVIVEEKQKLLDQVFREVKDRLREYVRSPEYNRFLEALIRDASIAANGGKLELLLSKQDAGRALPLRNIAKMVAEATGKDTALTISTERLNTTGGAIVTTSNRKITIDASMESIVERKRRELEPKMAQILFSPDN